MGQHRRLAAFIGEAVSPLKAHLQGIESTSGCCVGRAMIQCKPPLFIALERAKVTIVGLYHKRCRLILVDAHNDADRQLRELVRQAHQERPDDSPERWRDGLIR
jgi:ribosomal 50S subunit-associated protein YjgA (DUF615 family)